MTQINLTAIGHIKSTRLKPTDDDWDKETTYIELDANEFTEESLMGLGDFSHAEIIFYMDKVDKSKIEKVARHPRSNPNWPKVGIFAQRGKARHNQLGLTICKILKIEGLRIYLEGLDAIDGTPVLDIKPWVTEYSPRGEVFQPQWVSELMRGYWKL